ncbi:MAG: DUF1330 domain-containing protein [Candidatus Hydrogenedentes bacterium]|nr:DUF1330 domain-containing protein [Candidatus Hydrogenedentota bacterium]
MPGSGNQPEDQRAYILHAVWFARPHGAQRYAEYLEAASVVARKYGARRIEALIPVDVIQGDFRPDYVYITEWPSIEHFHRFVRDPAYRAAAHLREEACTKRIHLHCRRPSNWVADQSVLPE